MAMAAGELDPFNHAVSFVVRCNDQAEVDRYWDALLAGGHAEQCGWLRDRFGLIWQIVPRRLDELMTDPDVARARRVTAAMLRMVKLDIAVLESAAAGETELQEENVR
jgi:predicted 3-demethylubiquinone-9 3-methyltransferase (glyoxalase superfamily)